MVYRRERGENVSLNIITEKIIGCCIDVHQHLGPGLLESAYEECVYFELVQSGLYVERQKPIPVQYKSIALDCGYRIDLFVERKIVLELKSVDRLLPIHEAQLLTYLKLLPAPVGLLINFNVTLLTKGLRRLVNNFEEEGK